MTIGVCCEKREKAELLKSRIADNIKSNDHKIIAYNTTEISIDIEEKEFKSDLLIVMIESRKLIDKSIALVSEINTVYPACMIIYMSYDYNCIDYIYETEHIYFMLIDSIEKYLPMAMKKAERT